MNLSIVYTRAQLGVDAPLVTVETHLSNGLPSLVIVGLPETAVRESKERVRSALINSGFEFPTRRITINLAPADLPKQGGRYDLAIALSILVASGQLSPDLTDPYEFFGELALTGELRPIHGILPSSMAAHKRGKAVFVATRNANEAAMAGPNHAFGAEHLLSVCQHLRNEQRFTPTEHVNSTIDVNSLPDLRDVKGQFMARQALEIAAAGKHNLLMFGPPGTGKSLLASRLPSILPSLSRSEQIEVASIYSLVNQAQQNTHFDRAPFRAPHHTSSGPSLVGGGSIPKPGEISLAHHGVLFLDELPEFSRKVLEVLREPIESGEISISRANAHITFPARFQLVAAMNPCPCGYKGHPKIPCTDTPHQIDQYKKKLSGPLLDRFDLHVEVNYQPTSVLLDDKSNSEESAMVSQRVTQAREQQFARQAKLNCDLTSSELMHHCRLSHATRTKLEHSMDQLAISARGAHRILKVARTIADLQNQKDVEQSHVFQALSFRNLDRKTTK